MKKTFALFTLAAALFSSVAFTPSAEAGFGLPKIKIPNVGGGSIANQAKTIAVDVTVVDNMTGRPVGGCDVYIIDTDKVPSYRYSGDACYVTTTGKLVGKTDANGHFRTPSVKGNAMRILIFRPRGGIDIYRFLGSGTNNVEKYKTGIGTDYKNMTRLVFEG
ncbi:MAG: hypothetical protein MJ055_06790 [Phascolarctobacterium sp.]|nr:hypothetical protein [Phascolarctobacterium sp.]